MLNQNEIPNPIRDIVQGYPELVVKHAVKLFNIFEGYRLEAVTMWIETNSPNVGEVDFRVSKRDIMKNVVRDSFLNDNLKNFLIDMINSVVLQFVPDEIAQRMFDFDKDQLLDMNFVAFKAFIATDAYGNGGAFDQQVPYLDLWDHRVRCGFI